MEKRAKMILGVIIGIIIITVVTIIYIKQKDTKPTLNENTIESQNEIETSKNEIKDEIKENETEQENKNTEKNTIEENVTNTEEQVPVIGQEEQESNKENTMQSDEEKAIQLAKKEWGLDDDSVSYKIATKDGENYIVSVTSTITTEVMAWYRINIQTEEVSIEN